MVSHQKKKGNPTHRTGCLKNGYSEQTSVSAVLLSAHRASDEIIVIDLSDRANGPPVTLAKGRMMPFWDPEFWMVTDSQVRLQIESDMPMATTVGAKHPFGPDEDTAIPQLGNWSPSGFLHVTNRFVHSRVDPSRREAAELQDR